MAMRMVSVGLVIAGAVASPWTAYGDRPCTAGEVRYMPGECYYHPEWETTGERYEATLTSLTSRAQERPPVLTSRPPTTHSPGSLAHALVAGALLLVAIVAARR